MFNSKKKLVSRIESLEADMRVFTNHIADLRIQCDNSKVEIRKLRCKHLATTLVANSYDMKEVCDRCGDVVRYFDTAIEYNRAQVKTAKTNLKKLKRQLQAQCEREENKSGTTQSKNPVRN